MEEKEIGAIEKYFSQAGVGVLNLKNQELKIGDIIHIKGHTTDFTQKIESMQVEHKAINLATPGSSVGLKVKDRVRPGDKVYLVTA